MRILVGVLVVAVAAVGCLRDRTCVTDADCPATTRCNVEHQVCVVFAPGTNDSGEAAPEGGANGDAGDHSDAGADGGTEAVQEPICSSSQICWEHPTPQGNHLLAIWGTDSNTVWAGGMGGTILRWDGSVWKREVQTFTSGWVSRIHGSSSNDAWAIGPGTGFHWNGLKWTKKSLPENTIGGLWVRTPDDVWMVSATAHVYRWNGASFSTMGSAGAIFATGVYASAADDAWVVGSGGKIRRWDGLKWIDVDSGTTEFLADVWGTSGEDVWIVGEAGTILHWNGTSLSAVDPGIKQRLGRITGRGSDVWIAGELVILRWNGTSWSQVALPSPKGAGSLYADSGGDLWISGGVGLVGRLRAGEWTVWAAGPHDKLLDVWGRDSDQMWAVGENGLILRKSENRWTAVPSGTSSHLRAVWGSEDGGLWIAGDSGTLLRWTGSGFAPMQPSPALTDIHDLWASSENDLWVVGPGLIQRWDGSKWTSHSGSVPGGSSISGTGPGDIWVASDALYHFDGSLWSSVPVTGILSLHIKSATQGWGVGIDGKFVALKGSSWGEESTGVTETLRGVWGSAANDVWLVGSSGSVVYYNGFTSTVQTSGTLEALNAVWGLSSTEVWFGGDGAQILSFSP